MKRDGPLIVLGMFVITLAFIFVAAMSPTNASTNAEGFNDFTDPQVEDGTAGMPVRPAPEDFVEIRG